MKKDEKFQLQLAHSAEDVLHESQTTQRSVLWAFRLLQLSLAVLMVGAGADKFFQASLLWNQYLPPVLPWIFGTDASNLLSVIGVFEITMAFGLVFVPGFFGQLVSLWLLLANFNLLASGNFIDLGLRDMGLAIAAFALGTLGQMPGISTLHIAKPKRFRLLAPSHPRFPAGRWLPAR